MEEKQKPPFVPNDKQQQIIALVYNDFADMRKVREKKYRFLGVKAPQSYWTEEEKRFTSFVPPKEASEDDWQSNIVMGITRNAVLSQVAKAGLRLPAAKVHAFTKDGFVDTQRSRILQNAYLWSLQRQMADRLQQYVSLGLYIRGNVALYLGFEDKEIDVERIEDFDTSTGEYKTAKQKEKRWGPKRQIVPLHELYFPSMFANDIQEQSKCIWKQTVPYDVAKAEFGESPLWKYVVPGNYKVGEQNESFFYSSSQLTGKQVEILRHYGNPWKGGKDRHIVLVNGIPLRDMPLPFNHKKLPFGWAKNNPFSDKFMLGMGVPFLAMDHQDVADALMNMAVDKNTLSLLKPIMTDDPDPSARTFLSPGGLLQFTAGSQYQVAPIEGVTSSEFQMLQLSISQAKEFSGAFGAALSTARGGKITAKQAQAQEEEVKRLLGISMTNLEFLEKDACIQDLSLFLQFAPGSGKQLTAGEAKLKDGRKGRFVAFFAESLNKALALEAEDHKLSSIELNGEAAGVPTEAVAIAPDWFDLVDSLEAEVMHESAYLQSKALEVALEDEFYELHVKDPMIDHEELLRENLLAHNKDATKLIKKPPPQAPGGPPGQDRGPQGPSGPLTAQLAGKGNVRSLDQMG